jgi:hypothetical protein
MRIQIDKETLVARPAEGPVKQHSERCTTVPAQKMDITSPAKPGPGKAVAARITFDGKYWQSRRGQELSRCPKVCSRFYNGDRRELLNEILKQVLSSALSIKWTTPSNAAFWVKRVFDGAGRFGTQISDFPHQCFRHSDRFVTHHEMQVTTYPVFPTRHGVRLPTI